VKLFRSDQSYKLHNNNYYPDYELKYKHNLKFIHYGNIFFKEFLFNLTQKSEDLFNLTFLKSIRLSHIINWRWLRND
jgi:hypothetical protein